MIIRKRRYEPYGNKGVSVDGETYPSEHKDLGNGKGATELLQDYGCLHFKTNVILGISEPTWDKKELERRKAEDKEPIEYNGIKKTKYEWQQTQRRLEMQIRREKDIHITAKAAGDNILAEDCKNNVIRYKKRYNDMCEKVGLQPTPERMHVEGYKPGSGGKKLTNEGKSGIIKLPNADSLVISKNKFTEYALNPEKDANKAKAFYDALGYQKEDAEMLIKNITDNVSNFNAKLKPDNGYGARYEVIMTITGKNGKKANIKTAWILDAETGETRLTSAYVTKKKFTE